MLGDNKVKCSICEEFFEIRDKIGKQNLMGTFSSFSQDENDNIKEKEIILCPKCCDKVFNYITKLSHEHRTKKD